MTLNLPRGFIALGIAVALACPFEDQGLREVRDYSVRSSELRRPSRAYEETTISFDQIWNFSNHNGPSIGTLFIYVIGAAGIAALPARKKKPEPPAS